MKVEILGSGSAFSISRNTSSILVSDSSHKQWLIDCGPTIPRALWQRKTEINDIQVIYFTHIHPDHCAGLPALVNQWKSFHRSKPVEIYCQKEQQAALKSLVDLASWPEKSLCFKIYWHNITDQFLWQNWQLRTAKTQHEVTNKAIRIDTDNQSLFYSGDGRPTKSTVELMHHVDLAFQECASSKSLPENSSHGDLLRCQQLLLETKAMALGLYHCFDESRTDLQSKINPIHGLFMSQDQLVIDLDDKDHIERLSRIQK